MEEITNNPDTVSVITRVTYLLFLFLILAIFIERTAEIFMSLVKYLDLKLKGHRLWNNLAEKFRQRLDRLYRNQGSDSEDKKMLFKWILWYLVSDKPYTGGKEVIAAKSVRTLNYRIISRIFAFIWSLVFSIWVYQKFNLDLVAILENVGQLELSLAERTPVFLKIILTAGLLTAGSEPVHQLIVKLEKRGKSKKS